MVDKWVTIDEPPYRWVRWVTFSYTGGQMTGHWQGWNSEAKAWERMPDGWVPDQQEGE